MAAKRKASRSTPTSPWAVRRSSEAAVRRTAARTAPLTALLNPDLKLVSRDECRTSCGEPDGLPRDAQPRERRDHERQQAMLDLAHARGERLRGVAQADRNRPLGDDRPVVVLLVHVVHRG